MFFFYLISLFFIQTDIFSDSCSSLGPLLKEEEKFLWESGKESFEKKNYSAASIYLQRYINRYPAAPHFLLSHELLGESFLEIKQFDSAETYLQRALLYASEEKKISLRFLLIRVFLEKKEFLKVLLIAEEIKTKEKELLLEDSVKRVLMMARAHHGLSEIQKAKEDLMDLTKLNEKNKEFFQYHPSLQAERNLLSLLIESTFCEKEFLSQSLFSFSMPWLTEKENQNKILMHWQNEGKKIRENYGLCLQKIFPFLEILLETDQLDPVTEGLEIVKQSLTRYLILCEVPKDIKTSSLFIQTSVSNSFFQELENYFLHLCSEQISQMKLFIDWKKYEKKKIFTLLTSFDEFLKKR